MAKMKFDVSGSDPDKAKGGDFKQPKPGVYTAKIVQCELTHPEGKSERLEVVYEIINHKEFKGSRLFEYIVQSEAAIWKMDQFLQALGVATGKKRKGTFDTDDAVGMTVKVRVKGETYDGEYRARAGTVFAYDEDEDEESDEEDEADDEGDDDEAEEGDDDEDEDDEDDEDEDDEEGEDEDEGDDYDDWSIPELRTECKSRDLERKGTKTELIARLRENDGEGPY